MLVARMARLPFAPAWALELEYLSYIHGVDLLFLLIGV